MNRPVGIGPPSMRAMPGGYPNQQQQIPQSRSSSTAGRVPNNKMASNGASWNYPNGGPVSAAQGVRQALPPMATFAQSISGSQPNTPLDLSISDFPTLSTNNTQQNTNNPIAQSLWASSNARTLAQPSGQRPGQSNLILGHQNQGHHQNQQDELFASSSQLPSNQGAFRFGNQNPVGQSAISQQGPSDEFPPLNRNGDISQAMLQMQGLGFGGQSGGSVFGSALGGSHGQQSNGLLNQLSNSRAPSAGRTGSPGGIQGLLAASRASDMKSRASGNIENDMGAFSRPSQPATQNNFRDQLAQQSGTGPSSMHAELHNELYRTFGGDMQRQEVALRSRDFGVSGVTSESPDQLVEDPCAGMSDLDRFGLKGYLALAKGPYPDQSTLMTGIDLGTLGLDLSTPEMISEQLWSPFDDLGARPEVPGEGSYEIPDCYIVHNVQPIENKIPNFSDETLFLLFYQNTGEVQQVDAARELSTRNWRYHKKFQVWITKDLSMNPVQITHNSERGYYTFWNPKTWEREKREFTLLYSDLEMTSND